VASFIATEPQPHSSKEPFSWPPPPVIHAVRRFLLAVRRGGGGEGPRDWAGREGRARGGLAPLSSARRPAPPRPAGAGWRSVGPRLRRAVPGMAGGERSPVAPANVNRPRQAPRENPRRGGEEAQPLRVQGPSERSSAARPRRGPAAAAPALGSRTVRVRK